MLRHRHFHSETVAVYSGEKNNLPYDVVVERLHIDRPEPTPPELAPRHGRRAGARSRNTRLPSRSTAIGGPFPNQRGG